MPAPGSPYGWSDDAFRFAALARIGADIGFGLLPGFVPDIVHAHDWQCGLVAAYLAFDGRTRPASVFTIHNLAFQGQFPASLLAALGLPDAAFSIEGVEYYGELGFLKAGIRLSDRVTTVSPTYAAEICSPEAGMGLDGLLRSRGDRLHGILNGIDTDVWNPATDPLIAATFDASGLQARAVNKAALQARLGLTLAPDVPLFGVISRLSWQKGIDLVVDGLRDLVDTGAQLAVLGAGDPDGENAVRRASGAHPGQVGCLIGYDETLAHLIQAGCDALLVPSRFEPCGLTQLCALRYGAVPVVARTGGLADTVIDANPMALASGVATGLQFQPDGLDGLGRAVRRTVGLYRDRARWTRVQQNAMRCDVSWRDPGRRYAALYAEACAR